MGDTSGLRRGCGIQLSRGGRKYAGRGGGEYGSASRGGSEPRRGSLTSRCVTPAGLGGAGGGGAFASDRGHPAVRQVDTMDGAAARAAELAAQK